MAPLPKSPIFSSIWSSEQAQQFVCSKSTMNIPSECRTASIGPNHAMILPHNANPRPDGIFGKNKPIGHHDRAKDLADGIWRGYAENR
jgi:hypothetical protein